MAANINKTKYANAIKTLYERQLLERSLPNLVHGRWAMEATLNKFGTYELRRYESLSAVTSDLSEGVTPDEQAAPDLTVIPVSPLWYGAWLQFTDEVDAVGFDPLVMEFSGILGEQAGLSVDTMIRNAVTAGATIRYAGSAAARGDIDSTADKLTYKDLLKALAVLATNSARPAAGNLWPTIIHPHSWVTLMQDETFLVLFQRETGNSPLRNGSIGTLLQLDLYMTANAREYEDLGAGGTTDVYTAVIFGLRAYGVVGMANLMPSLMLGNAGGDMFMNRTGNPGPSPVRIIVKGLGETGFDPLEQRGTVGWKGAHEEVILQDDWLICIEHANDFSDV